MNIMNENYFNAYSADATPAMRKKAAELTGEFVAMQMRENSFFRRILPPKPIVAEELDKSLDNDRPMLILEKEPGSVGGLSVPFGGGTIMDTIEGSRFALVFDLIKTPMYNKTTYELMTYGYDIRKVIADNAIKFLHWEEDFKFISLVNAIVGAAASTNTYTQQKHHYAYSELTRDNLIRSFNIMTSLPAHMAPKRALMNLTTRNSFMAWGQDETNAQPTGESWMNGGFTQDGMFGLEFVVTSKNDLVKDGEVFFFADADKLGASRIIDDATLFVDKKAERVEMYSYECLGAAIANFSSVTKATFGGVGVVEPTP